MVHAFCGREITAAPGRQNAPLHPIGYLGRRVVFCGIATFALFLLGSDWIGWKGPRRSGVPDWVQMNVGDLAAKDASYSGADACVFDGLASKPGFSGFVEDRQCAGGRSVGRPLVPIFRIATGRYPTLSNLHSAGRRPAAQECFSLWPPCLYFEPKLPKAGAVRRS